MSDPEQDLSRVRDRYAAAVYAKDAAALIQLYDPEVRIFDAWGHWSCEGADAWQRSVEGWFTSLGSERVKVSFDEVHGHAGKEVSTLHAIVTYAALSADGVPLRSLSNRITWVLRTTGHVPRIVHEHTSAPMGFDDQKAILVRPLR